MDEPKAVTNVHTVRKDIRKLDVRLHNLSTRISLILFFSVICVALLFYDEQIGNTIKNHTKDTRQSDFPEAKINTKLNKLEKQLKAVLENQEKQAKKLQKMAKKANTFYETSMNQTAELPGNVPNNANVRIPSSLLEKGMEETLIQWVGTSAVHSNWCLLYRASDHQFSISKFHEKCANHAQTLLIVKSGNSIFGGYTPVPWNAIQDGYLATTGSFLFSLANPFKDPPTVFTCKNTMHAMYINSMYGPAFGSGQDLAITTTGGVYSNLGMAYRDSLSRGSRTFMGAAFSASCDYEVFGRC